MMNKNTGLINVEFAGIPAGLQRRPAANENRDWGPEYYFFMDKPLSNALIETIVKIKIIQREAKKNSQYFIDKYGLETETHGGRRGSSR
jgi:hypothetical protein